LDRSFSGLYGRGNDAEGDDEGGSLAGGGTFMSIYGWHYSAKLIAEFENIRFKEVFEMSTIEFLNTMAYLKAKNNYDNEQVKRLR